MTNIQAIVLGLLSVVTYNNFSAIIVKPASAVSQIPNQNSSIVSTSPKLDRSNFINEGADSGRTIRSTVADSNPMSWGQAETECKLNGGYKLIWNKDSSGQSLKTCIN
jgi:hypothetical protein